MTYVLPLLTLAMLGFIFWSAAFRLRRDRLRAMKSADRSHVILTPRQRARANLTQAFAPPPGTAEWEAELLASLRARD